MNIYLSKETVAHLLDKIDCGSCETQAERDALEATRGDLNWANDHRDADGRLTVKQATLDWMIGQLDWMIGQLDWGPLMGRVRKMVNASERGCGDGSQFYA